MPVVEHRYGRQWPSVVWARKTRDAIIEQLGGKCVRCRGWKCLTFDHIAPIRWEPRLVSWSQRMRRYKQDADAGLLQLLCIRCHGRKSQSEAALMRKLIDADSSGPEDPF